MSAYIRAAILWSETPKRCGGVVTREELIATVWGDAGSDERLTRAISLLRKALDDDTASPRFIETISKRGYRLAAPLDG